MATTGNVRYEFGELQMGQASMANCAGEFNGIRGAWATEVGGLGMEGWLDRAGTAFQDISSLWDNGANRCTEFQNEISRAIAQCQANGEDALSECEAIVRR